MAKKNNTADIGFEKEIWKAADLLRGNLDASEYKSVVLGLIFLKYISDRFEAKYNELVEEGDGFEEDKDEYTSENIFFVPQRCGRPFHQHSDERTRRFKRYFGPYIRILSFKVCRG